MKALKEKRIGLRSLWRRGLVILSLFALVLASCDDTSGGGGSSAPSGKVPLEINVIKQPANVSYEGLKVDVTGIQIEARYADNPNKWVPVTDLSQYGVWPKYTQRFSGDLKGGEDKTTYTYYTMGDGAPVKTPITVNVMNLIRSDSKTVDTPAGNPFTPGAIPNTPTDGAEKWAQGANVYVLPGYKNKYRVDEFPDFDNIKVQGQYSDNKFFDIPLEKDMRWEIRPIYKDGNVTCPGALVISIGGVGNELWKQGTADDGYGPPKETASNKGVEVFVYLEEVYKVNGIALKTPPAVEGIFYWEDDSSAEWLKRVQDAELEVTYSNGQTLPLSVKDAIRQNTVWEYFNPTGTEYPFTVYGIDRTALADTTGTRTFWPAHKDPQITFNYRQWSTTHKVVIYTKFTSVEATPKAGAGTAIDVDMSPSVNDKRGNSAKWFADQIDVYAWFTAQSDANKTNKVKLTYQAVTFNTDNSTTMTEVRKGGIYTDLSGGTYDDYLKATGRDGTAGGKYGTNYTGGPLYYTMDFGDPDYQYDTTRLQWYKGPNAWGQSAEPKNNGATGKNVTIYYTPGIGPTAATAPIYEATIPPGGRAPFKPNGPNAKNYKVPVTWKGIGSATPTTW